VYGTLAVDGVFDGVMELSDDEYSVERADKYLLDHPGFPSVIYRHSDIASSRLVNSSVCLSDLLHQRQTAQRHASAFRQHQPFSVSQEQVANYTHSYDMVSVDDTFRGCVRLVSKDIP